MYNPLWILSKTIEQLRDNIDFIQGNPLNGVCQTMCFHSATSTLWFYHRVQLLSHVSDQLVERPRPLRFNN